jgi:hypothetical protein
VCFVFIYVNTTKIISVFPPILTITSLSLISPQLTPTIGLLERLSDASVETLRALVSHLRVVIQHSEKNKMTLQNVERTFAICLGPNFGWLLGVLIENDLLPDPRLPPPSSPKDESEIDTCGSGSELQLPETPTVTLNSSKRASPITVTELTDYLRPPESASPRVAPRNSSPYSSPRK